MDLRHACSNILLQLTHLVEQIDEGDFSKPVESLSHSTIGQHLRHTLEFFVCMEDGYHNGLINYDKRSHDKIIENDKYVALATIRRVEEFIMTLEDKPLKLEAGYDHAQESFITIQTNAFRELVYNIEHAVHHMAIIKIGVREIAPYITLSREFGIAASTIRHRETADRSY